MRQILCKLQSVVDNEDTMSELQRRVCEMGVICRATFDVDAGDHLDALLFSAADVAILIECSIVIHDNTPRSFDGLSLDFRKLLHRDRRLAHLLESRLVRQIHKDSHVLDDAVTSIWPSYRPGAEGWRHLPEPDARWVTLCTDPKPNQRSQQVHYNLLTGELLIDGKLLGRLPHEILQHSTYQRIFGQVRIHFVLFCASWTNFFALRKYLISFLPVWMAWIMQRDSLSTALRYNFKYLFISLF